MPIPSWLGANKIFSGSGHQYIWGTLGNDLIKDTSGNDTIVGDPLYADTFKTFSENSEGGEYCYEIGGNDTKHQAWIKDRNNLSRLEVPTAVA